MYTFLNDENKEPNELISSLNMHGPLELSIEKIDNTIKARSPGNYALGYIKDHSFMIEYVGRSDKDLRGRLINWVGKYAFFKWSYAISEKAAYLKECRNYHDFIGNADLDNQLHPAKLDGKDWKCPVCGK